MGDFFYLLYRLTWAATNNEKSLNWLQLKTNIESTSSKNRHRNEAAFLSISLITFTFASGAIRLNDSAYSMRSQFFSRSVCDRPTRYITFRRLHTENSFSGHCVRKLTRIKGKRLVRARSRPNAAEAIERVSLGSTATTTMAVIPICCSVIAINSTQFHNIATEFARINLA